MLLEVKHHVLRYITENMEVEDIPYAIFKMTPQKKNKKGELKKNLIQIIKLKAKQELAYTLQKWQIT